MSGAWPCSTASRWLAALACAASITCLADDEETRWFSLSDWGESVGVDVEGLREDASFQGSSSTHEYLSIAPLVGARAHGSVYHQNLLSFDLNGEYGVRLATDRVRNPGSSTTTRDDNGDLVRYVATIDFLNAKPYNGSLFASQDHTYQNYDFFNTAVVDSTRYGGRASWTTPKLSLTANVGYRDERSDSLSGRSEFSDTYFNFNGIHHRQSGSTTLNYSYDEYRNQLNDNEPLNSVNNSVGLVDSETFGSRKQITASLGGSYSEYSYFENKNEAFTGNGNVTINHREDLDSFGTFNYTRNDSDPTTSSIFQGVTGVRHRLYESLTSTFDAHGTYDETSSPGATSSSDRYGISIREDYTKKLGAVGRLSLGGGVVADHEDHNSSGSVLTTIDEPHQLFLTTSPNFRPAFLNNPRVIRTTVDVRGPGGIPVQENIDFRVLPSGELTEIRLIQGSTILHNGDTVTVTYQSESLFDASFEAFNSFGQVRLDLFNTVGVYGRINSVENNAPKEVLTETLLDLVAGVDVRWRWILAGAEYEDYDSNFTQYEAYRFFQNFTHQLSDGSSVGVEFNQLFYKYHDDRQDTQYQFITHFNTRLTSWLTWNLEGGYFIQEFSGTEQHLGAARTDLTLVRGKLNLKLGYQYNYQLTTVSQAEEERHRNFVYLSLRRYF